MTESLQIQFSGSQTSQGVCVFAAGQLVQAKLLLDLPKPMKARSIKLHISGGAEVQWTEKETYSYQTTDWQGHNKTEYEYIDIDFGSCAVYMDHKAVMWTAPADQQQLLEAGHHQFPFTFHIPVNCPPSFEGKYGHIRYSCAVIIDRPWKFDKKTKTVFVVSPFVDLNTVEWALVPVIREVEKKIGFFLFKSGKLTVKLHLPKSGFVAGERIPLKIEINNGTSKKVRKVKANLLTNEVFTAQRGRVSGFDLPPCINRQSGQSFNRQTSLVVAKLKEPFAVAAHSNAVFQAQLAIPPCVPSFNNCPIIRVDYMLEIEVQTSATFSSSSSASMEIPLLLGTVPVRVSQPQMPISNADAASAVPAGSSNDGMEPTDSDPTAPPPAYEESVLTAGAKSAGKEGEQYTQRYPYFKDL